MREVPPNFNSASASVANAAPDYQPHPPTQPNCHANRNDLQLEKEPVDFDTSHLHGAPLEVEALVHNIKDVAQQFLYHWRTFPIILPPPLFSTSSDGEDTLPRKKYHLKDLFVAPSFDELDAVAVDSKGEPRKLTNKQLESIREKGLHKDKYGKPKKLNVIQLESIRVCGEFEVESVNFSGLTHRWRVSSLLQRGRDRRQDALLRDLALATRFLVVTARARLVSHCFSVSQSLKALLTGLLKLIDIIIGIPSLQAQNLDSKIKEERCRHLVAELVCRPEYEDSSELLCTFIRRQLRRATTEKFEIEKESSQLLPVPVPFVFSTPGGNAVDLRLFSRDIIRRALPTLVTILERETRGWFLHFRERLISEFRAQNKPDEEIEKEVNEAVTKEYLQRVYSSILAHPDILTLGEGIAQLLVQQAQSVVLMHRAVDNVQHKLFKTKESLREHMETEHPVLSRIGPWMRDRMQEAESRFIEECEWSAHEEALTLCQQQNLHQTIYFLNRDLTFMKENFRTVSAKLVEEIPALRAGDRLCPFCRRKIVKQKSSPAGSRPGKRESSQASFVQSSSSFSDLSQPTNSQQSDVSVMTQLPIINEAIAVLGHSPIPPRKLDDTNPNQNWIIKKVLTVAAELRNSANLAPNEGDIDDNDVDEKARFHDEMITQLKQRFSCITSYSERVQIFSLLPQTWSVAKIKRKFGATEYIVKAAKRIFERKGVLGFPDAKKLGTPLSEENKLKIYQVYEDEKSSTMMPGKDVESVKTSTGERVSKQKRLMCCNLVELYKLFKDRNPVIKVGFSKFSSLQPQHCVLAGSNETHVVCVCPYHENMKLMLLGSKLKLLTIDQDPINDYEDVLSLLTRNDSTDACYFRTCKACPGDRLLRDILCKAFKNHNKTAVAYNEWITIPRTTLAEFEISSEK